MKVLTIIKDDGITGIEYGMVEVPEKRLRDTRKNSIAKKYTQGIIRNRMKSVVERQKQK